MKTLCTLLMFIFSMSFCISQTVLTLDIVPEIGESYQATVGEGAVIFGEPGGNKQWDFSSLSTFENLPINVLSPSEVEGSDLFPEADFVWHFDEVDIYEFYDVTDSAIVYLGEADIIGENIAVVQQDRNDRLKLPLAIGDEYIYTTSSKTTIGGVSFGEAEYSTTVSADAWGDIKTPFGTYENVLRVSKLEVIDDVAEFNISWIHPESFIPVMIYVFGDDPDFIDTYLFVDHASLVSSTEEVNSQSIDARYVGGVFAVTHNLSNPTFQIVDINGKSISHSSRHNSESSTLYPTQKIAAGMCLIIVQSDGGKVVTKKVMVSP